MRVGEWGTGSRSNNIAALTMQMLLPAYVYLHWCDNNIIYNKSRCSLENHGVVVGWVGGCLAGKENYAWGSFVYSLLLLLLLLLLSAAMSREIYN